MRDSMNFLLAGVGGQGIILASNVLVNVGLAAGYQAKQAEVHGMSQRGGSVTSFVRWGKTVHSPLVGAGEVDILLAFEKLEALRNLNQLRPGGLALVNQRMIEPLSVISGNQVYPADSTIKNAFDRVTPHAVFMDGEVIANELGSSRVVNMILLGSLSALLERDGADRPELASELWLNVIVENVPPKHVALNCKAFEAGRQAVVALND